MQVDPKTIDIELKGQAWVGGRSRKKSGLGLSLMSLEETQGHGYLIFKKSVKGISMLPKKREGRFDKWLASGVMLTGKE